MALTSATGAEYATFLTKYGYTIAIGEDAYLPLSFAFLSALPFCSGVGDNAQILEAQCFIAYAMSANGGGWNPAAIADAKTLIEKGLGRNAIVKKWSVNETLIGTDAMSLLRSVPMALALLSPYLCPLGSTVDGTQIFSAGAFVV